jgi:triosephosphate isomerase
MRKKLIAGNWKMNKTLPEATGLAGELTKRLGDVTDVTIAVAPNFVALASVADVLRESSIILSAQDLFWEEQGAYTGETSAPMLRACGVEMVIIGHSERRKYFGETDDTVAKKNSSALASGLTPIFCVGETKEERESGNATDVVHRHITGGLSGIGESDMLNVVIAYEPVWAIGTGVNATPDQAQEMHQFIRDLVEKMYNKTVAQDIKIVYGGSVTPDNAKSLLVMPDIDGALVGGASLKADVFERIVRCAEEGK